MTCCMVLFTGRNGLKCVNCLLSLDVCVCVLGSEFRTKGMAGIFGEEVKRERQRGRTKHTNMERCCGSNQSQDLTLKVDFLSTHFEFQHAAPLTIPRLMWKLSGLPKPRSGSECPGNGADDVKLLSHWVMDADYLSAHAAHELFELHWIF